MQSGTLLRSKLAETPSGIQHRAPTRAVRQTAVVPECPLVAAALAIELIVSTEALAAALLGERRTLTSDVPPRQIYCTQCLQGGLYGNPILHGYRCVVGDALAAAKLLRDELVSR